MILKKFADCLVVKGYCRSLIHDLTRFNFIAIPNSLAEFLEEIENLNEEDIKGKYDLSEHQILTREISKIY
jgi:hypothetical protein